MLWRSASGAQRAVAVIPGRVRHTVLALVLALVAWPLVVATWDIGYRGPYIGATPALAFRWTASAGGVFLSALVAGQFGGWVLRRNVRTGVIFTFSLALAVAIAGAQLLPAYLGQNVVCWVYGPGPATPCDPFTATWRVILEDLQSLPLLLLFAPLVQPVAVLTLGLGVALWAWLLTPARHTATNPAI